MKCTLSPRFASASPSSVATTPEPPKEPQADTLLTWINKLTPWGLTILGAALFLGLFTRTSCLLAVHCASVSACSSAPM